MKPAPSGRNAGPRGLDAPERISPRRFAKKHDPDRHPLTARTPRAADEIPLEDENTRATGIVINSAAAIFNGNGDPEPSSPLTRVATRGNVFSCGLCREMMKCGHAFHEPWNDRMVRVITAGRAMGSTTDQKVRKAPAPSSRADSSTSV